MIHPNVLEISEFALLATDDQITRTTKALESNNIHVIVVETGVEAKKAIFAIIPENAEVFTASSVTLDTLGVSEEVDKSGRYNSVRAKLVLMDRKTQNREMQKMGTTPEYMIGSVHAVTETGQIIIASKTGSQLAGYVAGAAHVIWVAGTQKIVPTLKIGLRRIEEYTLPLENSRALMAYGKQSSVSKLLIVNDEAVSGRTTMIFVKENLGF
jgi:LUD domain